ncbi:NUDIX domain-containing protein [Nocardia seriolae]|uniref:NUDIX hydrolase n=1 Tax=Nocardia seriolae TaxID=37332 RepID=A0ABC9YT42_9NOCA|nr:NUDIX hydrolase [Nocardia seriolae]OJF81672.1 ADP-ribose pyrophosphatase [Nocardia seriolae]PSK30752.1 NUDIX hydrolase [Nocardia seriolae]QOW31020.1 NUDIX hydrolase [Nocardia seriolae]QUN18235.1 NUDIX hydrolase [Nocardia seriolae]WNJ61490.1 NUDIX hydrolase [Nocardia seriolae]
METLRTREIYSNRWITLREDIVRQADGEESVYAFIRKADFAIAIPWDGERFHLVEQYRYPLRRRSWEFPGGSVAGGEFDPIAVARQELREETGLRAGRLTLLGKLTPAPATSTHYGHVVLAEELTAGAHEREPSEQDMESAWFSRAELETMIADSVIVDAQTIAAYSLLLLHERRRARD